MSDSNKEARDKAELALLEAIATGLNDLKDNGYRIGTQAGTVQSFALAYRYVVGGDQPETVSVRVSK